MTSRHGYLVTWLAIGASLALSVPTRALEPPDAAAIAARAAYARQAPVMGFAAESTPAADASSLAAALDLPADRVLSAEYIGSGMAVTIAPGLGVIEPLKGDTLVVLSSGIAGTSLPEPGIDLGAEGPDDDTAVLRIVVDVPEGANRLSFSYIFLSAEYPDYVGSVFNDTFTAFVTDASGTREIARSSVNSAAFFPASSSRASGTGFDLFTEDPSGVDTSFGTGLPDAGLTQRFAIDTEIAGDTVTIEFSIGDLGDGVLDSAVIIDNLAFTSLEAVDPNPDLLVDGAITTQTQQLAQLGERRRGAAADGVTRLLLRNGVSGPGSVEFCLDNGASAPADGGLQSVGAGGRNRCVVAPVIETSRGAFAFAVYQSPDNFDRGSDSARAEREVAITATFTPDSGQASANTLSLTLTRPPLVLTHGLWSNSATWTFSLATDARFRVTPADYRQTNASWFAVNQGVGAQFVAEALVRARLDGIAATQVDYAGHSMGGILGRIHATLPGYAANVNFNAGDINKLITLNTPHTGSPLGNLVNGTRAIPVLGGWFEDGMRAVGHPVDEGALDDLANRSTAIQALRRVEVPAHTMVGAGGSDALTQIPGWIGLVYRVINFFSSSSNLFGGLQHDGVVGRSSQRGGLPDSAYSLFGGFDSIHTSVTGSGNYSARLGELLGADPNGAAFAELPAVAAIAPTALPNGLAAAAFPTAGYTIAGADLLIVGPADGTVASPGETVTVVVEDPNNPASVSRVLLVGEGIAAVDDTAPFVFDITVPTDFVGTLTLSAIGTDGSGGFIGSSTLDLTVASAVALVDLTILPQDPILLDLGQQRGLSVTGEYADGQLRDITDPSAGTQYRTADAGVVTVSAEGVVTSVGAGVTTVIARNGSLQDSISVTVYRTNAAPIADAGQDRAARLGSPVTLDGTASTDPDGEDAALGFSWLQTTGPSVTLSGAGSATPRFTPSAPGTYVFGLVVSDGQNDSAPASVAVTVPPLGDIDLDADIDQHDLNLLLAARNQPAQGPNDLRDLNGDGAISAQDSRLLVLRCTRSRCATE